MPFIIKDDGKIQKMKSAEIIKDAGKLRALLHETRWKILELLAEKPRHALEIARILGEHEQKIYYHIRQLENMGLIRLVKKVERHGTIAKIYTLKSHAFILDLPGGTEESIDNPIPKKDKHLLKFLHPHIINGKINTTIVVGSPDPHGPYQVRARDAHHAIELAVLLGSYAPEVERASVKLDVEVKASKAFDSNMILVGGVLTNTITYEINPHLPIRFDTSSFPFRKMISTLSGKTYEYETSGLIAKLPNPFNPEKSIIVLAGTRHAGTKAAILALCKFSKEVLSDYEGEDLWARVIRGMDLDGDGRIDSVEVIE